MTGTGHPLVQPSIYNVAIQKRKTCFNENAVLCVLHSISIRQYLKRQVVTLDKMVSGVAKVKESDTRIPEAY